MKRNLRRCQAEIEYNGNYLRDGVGDFNPKVPVHTGGWLSSRRLFSVLQPGSSINKYVSDAFIFSAKDDDGRPCQKTWGISLLPHKGQHNHGDFARGLAPIIVKARHHLNHPVV